MRDEAKFLDSESVAVEAVKVWPGKGGAYRKVGATANLDRASTRAKCGSSEETIFEIEQKSDEGQKICCLANSLITKAPNKGLGADSEEKHEPVSDIDTAAGG